MRASTISLEWHSPSLQPLPSFFCCCPCLHRASVFQCGVYDYILPISSIRRRRRKSPNITSAKSNSFFLRLPPVYANVDDSDYAPSESDEVYESESETLGESSEELEGVSENGIEIEIEKTGKNRRRIKSKVAVDASLQTVWEVLTNYEGLADFIPGLAVSQLLEKRDNFARLYQIGQQNLVWGLKFNAKGIVDCYEKDIQTFPFGQRRDIEFKMIEGDFQIFEGKWSVEECRVGEDELCDSVEGRDFQTTLFYVVDVEPKLWLPVRLVEGRLCEEIKTNLSCIRDEAQKAFQNPLPAH